ncbi:F0F1 ATP synthase subunit alpha, partial [Candidatus Parcubacteria bacterium]
LDDVPVDKVKEFESGFYNYVDNYGEDVLADIQRTKDLDEKLENKAKKLLNDYRQTLDYLTQHSEAK